MHGNSHLDRDSNRQALTTLASDVSCAGMSDEEIQHYVGRLLQSRRIIITGNQGAGKTTLGQKLELMLGIPFFEHPDEDLSEIEQSESWILHGDWGFGDRADLVINLDFPMWLCLFRSARRGFLNLSRFEVSSKALRRICSGLCNYCRCLGEQLWFPFSANEQKEKAQRDSVYTISMRSPRRLDALVVSLKTQLRDRPEERLLA